MRQQLLFIALAFVAMAFTFPDWYPVFDISIDGSCAWLYNYFWEYDRSQLAHLVFPHGALDFLQSPLPIGHNLGIGLVVNAMLRFLFVWTGLQWAAKWGKARLFFQFLISILWLHLNRMDVLTAATTGYCLLIVLEGKHPKQNGYWLAGAALLTVMGWYVKTAIGLPCVLMYVVAVGLLAVKHKKWLFSIAALLLLPLFLVLGWLLLFGHLAGFGTMLIGSFYLTIGNSSAVCHYPDNNGWLLGIFWIILLVWPLFTTHKMAWSLLIMPAFAFWKYGISREDIWHMDTSFRFYLWLFSVLILSLPRVRWYHCAMGLVATLCFFLNLRHAEGWSPYYWHWPKPKNGLDWVLNFETKKADALQKGTQNLKRQVLPDSLRQIIGDNTVDIFPWHYSYAAANDFHLSPRHIPQSYAAYHPWLDQIDADFFAGEKAPNFIIFHLKPYEEGGQLTGLDARYLLQDAPKTLLQIIDRYRVHTRNPKFLLLERTKQHFVGTKQVFPYQEGWKKQLPTSSGIVCLKVNLQKTLYGRVKSLLYKDDPVMADIYLDGLIRRIKIVPGLAHEGLWIAPWIEQADGLEPYIIPDDVQFYFPLGSECWSVDRSSLAIEWIPVDPLSGWIPARQSPPLPADIHWTPGEGKDTVLPDGYSQVWSTTITDTSAAIVKATARIKMPANSGCCQLVSSVTDANGTTAHYASMEYCGMGIGAGVFWPVGLQTRLPKNIIVPYTVKVYVWNTGTRAVQIKDLQGIFYSLN